MTIKILLLTWQCLLLHTYRDPDFNIEELSLFYPRAFAHFGISLTGVFFLHISGPTQRPPFPWSLP